MRSNEAKSGDHISYDTFTTSSRPDVLITSSSSPMSLASRIKNSYLITRILPVAEEEKPNLPK